jgi:hypothetical protein
MMEQKLDFSLPNKAEKRGHGHVVGVALILASIWFAILSPYVLPKGRTAPEAAGSDVSFQQAQDLAGKLSSRGLYERAAIVLKDAAGRTKLAGADSAKLYFQIAEYLAQAGRYDEAVEYYYRSEMFGKVADEQQMNAKLKDCFEKMGKFAALEREIAARTSIGGEQKKDVVIVAEIGTEKITAEKLDEMIEQQIEDQMARYAAFLKPEQVNERKKELFKMYTEPQSRQKFLEMWIGQEVLYREAMATGLADKPDVKRAMQNMAKSVVAEQAMNREVASKVSITETDARTWYEAHKSEYVDPAVARISHILAGDEAAAKEAIEKAKGGADFATLAREYSKDAETKDKGGLIDVDVARGDYLPVIGKYRDLNAAIFAMKEPGLIPDAVKTDKGWEVVRVDKLTPERQKSFDESGDAIYQRLRSEKTRDIQQAYIKELMDKFNVVLHTSAFGEANREQKTTAK